jgi:hypothetical protein
MKYDIGVFFRNCVTKIQDSLKSDRITGTVHEDQCKSVIISRSALLRIKMFQANIVEKIKTQFLIQLFSKIVTFMR